MAILPLAAEDINPAISVSGSASIPVRPDIARFTVSASFVEESSEEARKLASGMINEAISILEEAGIDKEDISTRTLSASPEYRWVDGEQILVGQRAEQSIEIVLRQLSSLGDIYDSLSKLSGISISSVQLDKEDKSAEQREARISAMKDARTKAEDYAEAAGMKAGQVISITESSGAIAYPRAFSVNAAAKDMASSTEYLAPDITVSASVSVVYQLENQ